MPGDRGRTCGGGDVDATKGVDLIVLIRRDVDDRAGRVGRRVPRKRGEALRAALGNRDGADGLTVWLEDGDPVHHVLADQDDVLPVHVLPRRDSERRGAERPGRPDDGVRGGVEYLHPVVARIVHEELAVQVGDVARVVEVARGLDPATADAPKGRPIRLVGRHLVVPRVGDIDGAVWPHVQAGGIHRSVPGGAAADLARVGRHRDTRVRHGSREEARTLRLRFHPHLVCPRHGRLSSHGHRI